jgi:hypothetical protein
MKRVILSMFVLAISLVTFANTVIAEGKTHSAFGDYKIETLDQKFILNGKELDAFVITYENTDLEVTVVMEKQRKCRKYYVLSDDLSVQYVCNARYFGVEKLDKGLGLEGYRTSDKLDVAQFFHQKVITSEKNSDIENSKLIAAFYPVLIKD